MPALKSETYEAKKKWLMEQAYDCFAEQGLHGTGIRALAKYAGVNSTVFYTYFKNLDDLIEQSTAYCMQEVEESFMDIAPKSADDIDRFIDEVPKWGNEKYCKKFRLMYQVYTHPKYREAGLKFFDAMNQRYAAYSESIAKATGISVDIIRPLVYIFVRDCVFYFLFQEEDILKEQMNFLKQTVHLYVALGYAFPKMSQGMHSDNVPDVEKQGAVDVDTAKSSMQQEVTTDTASTKKNPFTVGEEQQASSGEKPDHKEVPASENEKKTESCFWHI